MQQLHLDGSEWWDCLVLGAGGPSGSGATGFAGLRVWALRRLGMRAASLAASEEGGGAILAWLRPEELRRIDAGPGELPAEVFRPVLLQSRWVHASAEPWALRPLREASLRGGSTSCSLGTLPPGSDPEAAEPALRFAQAALGRLSGASPAAAASWAEAAGELGPGEIVLRLDAGALLWERAGGGRATWLELDGAAPGGAGAAEESGFEAGYLAARRSGLRPPRALTWALLASEAAVQEPGAEPLDRPGMDRRLHAATWNQRAF